MTNDRRCEGGGFVVPADEWLPDDPREHNGECLDFAAAGCNRLACERCARPVRSALGAWDAPPLDPAALYSRSEWSPPPGRPARLYACACHARVVLSPGNVGPDPDSLDFDTPRWRCAGHPGLRPPGAFEGIGIPPAAGWPALVAERLTRVATSGLSARLREHPGFLLTRLYVALEDPADRDALSRAVAARAAAPDVESRAAAALFFAQNPLAEGLDALASAWRAEPGLYAGQKTPWGPVSTLRGLVVHALAFRALRKGARGELDAPGLEALRWAALTPPGLGATLLQLPELDGAWAEENLPGLVAADPSEWHMVLDAIRTRRDDRLAPACGAALERGVASREELLEIVEELYGRERRTAIDALL